MLTELSIYILSLQQIFIESYTAVQGLEWQEEKLVLCSKVYGVRAPEHQ